MVSLELVKVSLGLPLIRTWVTLGLTYNQNL